MVYVLVENNHRSTRSHETSLLPQLSLSYARNITCKTVRQCSCLSTAKDTDRHGCRRASRN
jgi:hypothetical protein